MYKSDVITPSFVQDFLKKNKIKQKTIALELGVDYTNISSWISGRRPMSRITKNMFYYYISVKIYPEKI